MLFKDTVDTSLKSPSKKHWYKLAYKSILNIYQLICNLNALYTKKAIVLNTLFEKSMSLDNYLKRTPLFFKSFSEAQQMVSSVDLIRAESPIPRAKWARVWSEKYCYAKKTCSYDVTLT